MDNLCGRCRDIFSQPKASLKEKQAHHQNIHCLIKASDGGCELCSYLWSIISTKDKVLLGVDLDDIYLERSRIFYKLYLNTNSMADVECIFDFLTWESKYIQIKLVFLYQDSKQVYCILNSCGWPLLTNLQCSKRG